MHPIAKPILIAVGGFLLLWASAVLFVNIYLQSAAVQARMRDAISRETGSPIQIQQTYYTPWSGIVIGGVVVPGAPGSKQPLLQVRKIQVHVNLLALLEGHLAVKNLTLVSPSLAFRPASSVEEPVSTNAILPPPTDHLPEPAAGIVQKPIPTPASGMNAHSSIPPLRIESFHVTDGRAVFLDAKGIQTAELEGIRISAEPRSGNALQGTYHIDRGKFWNSLRPSDFSGNFTWSAGQLTLPDLQAVIGDGRLAADFQWMPDSSFALAASIQGALLQKLAEDAGMDANGTQGRFDAKLALTGSAGRPESFTGSAETSLVEARMEPIELIRQFGELLRIDELRMLELKNAEAKFTIRDSKVVVETLALSTENLMIDATGSSGFDGRLDLQARLHVTEKLRKETGGLLGKNFKPSETPGYSHMPFAVTGTLTRPKSDLLDKFVGLRIGQDVGGLLKNLLRTPQKKKNKPATEASQAP